MKIRSFIAVEPDGLAKQELANLTKLFNNIPWAKRIRWTPVNNMHLTLRFLGTIEANMVEKIWNNIEVATTKLSAFTITLTMPLLFPSIKRARIIAAISDKNGNLLNLAKIVESAVTNVGLANETKPFRGHITIGRSRTIIKNISAIDHHQKCFSMQVNNISFYASTLEKSGAKHTVLKTIRI